MLCCVLEAVVACELRLRAEGGEESPVVDAAFNHNVFAVTETGVCFVARDGRTVQEASYATGEKRLLAF